MCLAIPAQIESIDEATQMAIVEVNQIKVEFMWGML